MFDEEDKLFYITLTCYDWLPLIAGTEGYDSGVCVVPTSKGEV